MQEKLTVAATTENLSKVLQLVTASAEQCGFSAERINELQVATEEAFINVVRHAYADGGDCTIACEVKDDAVILTMTDSGAAFDPAAAADPDTAADIAHRPIGGLGILLIKKFTDDLSYRRDDDKNVLVMTARRDQSK